MQRFLVVVNTENHRLFQNYHKPEHPKKISLDLHSKLIAVYIMGVGETKIEKKKAYLLRLYLRNYSSHLPLVGLRN